MGYGAAANGVERWVRTSPSRHARGAMPFRRLALGLSFLSALGCGDTDRPPQLTDSRARPIQGCERFSYETCDVLERPCQTELFGLMACLRGESASAGEPPVVRLLNEADAIALVAQSDEGVSLPTLAVDFQAQIRGLELLGLLDPGSIEQESDVLEVTIASVLAFYLPPTREVIMIDRGAQLAGSVAMGVLAHELVHALQDASHGLAEFTGSLDIDSDARLARTSVVEGEATLYQRIIMLAQEGLDLDGANSAEWFDYLTRAASELSFGAGSPLFTAGGIFPYTYGTRYAGAEWLEGKSEALDALFDAPPASSLEVMRSSDSPMPALHAFRTVPAALDGYALVGDDVAGAWVASAVLLGLSPDEEAASSLRALADRWRGDRFWIYQSTGSEAAVAALWAIEWADADAAAHFAEGFTSLPGGDQARVEVMGASTHVAVAERRVELTAWVDRLGATAP